MLGCHAASSSETPGETAHPTYRANTSCSVSVARRFSLSRCFNSLTASTFRLKTCFRSQMHDIAMKPEISSLLFLLFLPEPKPVIRQEKGKKLPHFFFLSSFFAYKKSHQCADSFFLSMYKRGSPDCILISRRRSPAHSTMLLHLF